MKASKPAEAEATFIAALSHYERLNRAKPRMTQYKESLALTFADLATVEKRLKKSPESLQALEKAIVQMREISEQVGDSRIDRKLFGQTATRLGDAYAEARNYPAAAREYEEARQQRRSLMRMRAPSTDERIGMGLTCFRLGNSLFKLKEYREAASAFEEAVESFRAALHDRQTDDGVRKDLSSSLGNCAIVYRSLARPADALAVTEERVKLWPNNHAGLIDAASDFAWTYDFLVRKGEEKLDLKRRAIQLALQTIQQAQAAGLPNLDKVRSDAAFAKIREAEEFKELLKGM